MTIDKRIDARGRVTLLPAGMIDVSASAVLHEAIAAVSDDVPQLVLDFKDVTYITSSGLRELLVCRKRFNGERLRIINVGQEVMDVLEMVGFDAMLPIETVGEQPQSYIFQSFKEMLARRVQECGDRVAVRTEGGDYTWRFLDQASQIIANDLEALGVRVGTHVGICGRNSINWLLVYIAAQKLGALAMLINPNQTAVEIGRVCAIGDVTCLCFGEIPSMKDEGAFLNAVKVPKAYDFRNRRDFRTRLGEYPALAGRFLQQIDPDAPGVVIFTSGSTGRPKGVILSSFNLFNAAATQVKLQRMNREDRSLLVVPLFHILGLVVCLYPCAMVSATLVIPEDIHTDTMVRMLERERCTMLHAVPTLLIALMNNDRVGAHTFDSLRCSLLAGSAVSEAQMRAFMRRMPNNHFMNAYGLSEMAPVSVTEYGDTEAHLLRTVGRPVENIRIRIMDRATGGDCPAGAAGEILVQGINLMTGYYKLPLEDQAIDGGGWLHTGDMGLLDDEGYLRLLGRYKELIIRGGENIMPAEVEEAVAALEGVSEVKVVGVPSDFYGEEVAACVKLAPGAVWYEESARLALSQTLARYKVPRYFLVYNRFPLLSSGKIDIMTLRDDAAKRIHRITPRDH